MTHRLLFYAIALIAMTTVIPRSYAQDDNVMVVITTQFGEIEVALDPAKAPNTTANFLRYLDAGHYNGGQFHRTVTPDNQPNDTSISPT